MTPLTMVVRSSVSFLLEEIKSEMIQSVKIRKPKWSNTEDMMRDWTWPVDHGVVKKK